MSQEITLIDLPSQEPCQSWSANVLKTRIALNYKNIPYKTEWIPYHILQETLKSKGISANDPGSFAEWTVPVIKLADGSYLMDSDKIAPKLEELQPTPSLHLDLGLHQEVYKMIGPAFFPFVPYFMPRVCRDIVVKDDYQWFYEDRSKRFGGDMFELEKLKGGDVAYKDAQPGLDALAKFWREHKKDEGPFLLGSQVSYGDFVLVALIHMFKRIGNDAFEAFVGGRQEFSGLYEACQPWLQKMD